MKAEVKELRELTGAPIQACYKALKDSGGDIKEAIKKLREEGLAQARLREKRPTREGIIAAYIHFSGKIGVLLELNCETDSLAATKEFKELAHQIALQITATNPLFIKPEDISTQKIEEIKKLFYAQAEKEGKPHHICERIAEGRLKSYYNEVCLLAQPFIKDPQITVKDYIDQFIANWKENIVIKRFVRFEVGKEDVQI